jgi:hypothetical protein
MNNWKVVILVTAVVLLFCGAPVKADDPPVVLTFEGIGDDVAIGNFYNGGAGGSLGVSFGPSALALVSTLSGGSGNFSNAPSGNTAAFFLTAPDAFMDVAGGFSSGFSLFYSAPFVPATVTVWSGLDGTGTLLGTLSLPVNSASCPPIPASCLWSPVGLSFAGTAESVDFSGSAGEVVFDNVTLGSATPGGTGPTTPTPEPATLLLVGAGSIGLMLRRKKLA